MDSTFSSFSGRYGSFDLTKNAINKVSNSLFEQNFKKMLNANVSHEDHLICPNFQHGRVYLTNNTLIYNTDFRVAECCRDLT